MNVVGINLEYITMLLLYTNTDISVRRFQGKLAIYTEFRMRTAVFRYQDPSQSEAKGGR